MDGVILFADDMVFANSYENRFFHSLLSEKKYPVLAVHNLDLLERTVRSISTYRALILDWNFQRENIEDEVVEIDIPDENPGDFLLQNDIFSLIYIYSDKDIEKTEVGKQLMEKYGNKIKFKKKDNSKETPDQSADAEKAIIIAEILKFEEDNGSLKVPFHWSQSINKSTQEIFRELEVADPNWIKDIYKTAEADGGEPLSEVINVFQHLLAESIIQNKKLKDEIGAIVNADDVPVNDKEKSLAKLYQRIFYTKLTQAAPVMTGDIFLFDDNTSGIVITPECDIGGRIGTVLDFVLIDKTAFNAYLEKQFTFKKADFADASEKRLKPLIKAFNQDEIKYHLLPSFPFNAGVHNETALIDFSTGMVQIPKETFDGKRGPFKLNSPYIHQLRQRYLSYIGRVGVASIPLSLRHFNLK
jgi:hypothetical protein